MKVSITRGNDVIVSSSDEEITMQEVKAIKRKERYTNHESTLRVSLRSEPEIIVKKNIINPDKKDFEVITLFGIPVLFANERITKDNIPNDISISIYNLRNDDEYFCELKDEIIVNHGGTILAIRPVFDTRSQNGHVVTSKAGYPITKDDYNFIGIPDYSINDYINNYDHLVDEYGYLPKLDNSIDSTEEEQVDQESIETNADEIEEINKLDDSAEEEEMEFDVKSKFTAPEPEEYENDDEDILPELPRSGSNKVIDDFFAKEAKEERMYGTKKGGSRDKYVKGGAKRGKKNTGRRNVDNY